MLGELLDKVAPPPVFEPERVLSPQRLAETGAGQAKLRQDIHCNLKRVIDVFRELDTDTSGAVDRREFRRGLGAILGKEYADDELDELFDVIDASGDGMIQYQELAKALRDAAPKPSCSTPATSSVHMQSSASARALPTSGSSAQHKVQRAASATAVTRRLRHGNGKERASGSVASPTDASPEDGARRAMRRSITGGDPEAGGRGACEGGEGGVEGDEAGSAHSWQAVLHPLRQREVLQLFADFKQQHLDGVCKVGRFDRLLRIKYKTEGRDQIEAMMDLVIEREAEQQAEAARQEQAAKDAAVLFDALDVDQSHEISLEEFLNLRKIVDDFRRDLSKSQLRALFYAADKDHDGAINFEEFRSLLHTADLLKHHDEIVQGGRALRVQKELESKSKDALWMVGVPDGWKGKKAKEASAPKAPAPRPSLVSLSSAMLNMRKAMQGSGNGFVSFAQT